MAAIIALACLLLAAVVLSTFGAFLVKRIAILATLGMAAITLSGCGANQAGQLAAIQAIVQDPNCQHDDKIAIVTGAGGIAGSFTASAERHCPVHNVPLNTGSIVGQAPAAPPATP